MTKKACTDCKLNNIEADTLFKKWIDHNTTIPDTCECPVCEVARKAQKNVMEGYFDE